MLRFSWYFEKCPRLQSEKLLLHPANDNGAFLIRPSESVPNAYALSVRDGGQVKHYVIHSANGVVTITRRRVFRNVQQLVEYYSTHEDDLGVKLVKPCISASNFNTPKRDVKRNPSTTAWEISRESLKFTKKLGEGRFGAVSEGLLENRTRVAIKCLKSNADSSDGLAEGNFMKTLDHPNLLRLYGVCTKEQPMWIVTELMKESLLEFLRRSGKELLKLPQLINFGAQIASGMAYLENRNYINRNLAARNVLLGDNFTVKIADVGLVIFSDCYPLIGGERFPIKWTAPEALFINSFSMKSDVWSFGIVLMELVTYGAVPYPGLTSIQALKAVKNGFRMGKPPGCPVALYEIMIQCWNAQPTQRPTFETLQRSLEEYYSNEDPIYTEAASVVHPSGPELGK